MTGIQKFFLSVLCLMLAGCGSTATESSSKSSSASSSDLAVYKSTDGGSTWTSLGDISISGMASLGAVDPCAVASGNTILLYYFGSNNISSDPAGSQPDDTWRFYVAQSTDGINFTEIAEVITRDNSMTDPYVLRLADNTFRMYISKGSQVLSATANSDGLAFSFESGDRNDGAGGVPGALITPSGDVRLYYSGINSKASSDGGFTFPTSADVAIAPTGSITSDANPLRLADGTYLMVYKITPTGGTSPANDQAWLARSTDGITWTGLVPNAFVTTMSVPTIVEASNGDLYIYGTSF